MRNHSPVLSASGAAPPPTPVSASFVYNGDGARVLATVNGATTVYIGDHSEVDQGSGVVMNHYHAGSQRVALRVDGVLYFLLSDHLGSTRLATERAMCLPSTIHIPRP